MLDAQSVNAAHVAQNWSVAIAPFADVVDMVELNDIASSERIAIAPSPTDADARVVKVGNFVVDDAVVGTLTNPNSDGAVEHLSAINDGAIADLVAEGLFCFIAANLCLTNFDAACT